MPPEFQFPSDRTMLWIATPIRLEDIRPGQGGMGMVARLKEGVTAEQAASELTRLSKELPARFGGPPAFARLIEQHRAVVTPVLETIVGPTARRSLWVLLGAVSVVLLIACANVANLFMVRAEGRTRDLAIRRAIGASRAQLVRLQMAEAFVVALAAGVLAVVLSRVTLPLFIAAAPELPRLADVRLDLTTLAAAFGLVLLAALACGTAPALRASAPDFARLREGGRGNTGRRRRGRDMLVVAQTALALVLLIGSALLVQSFNKLRRVDPGYRTDDIYTFQFAPDRPFRDGPSWGRLHLAFMDRLRALPGVTGVGLVNNLPLDEGTSTVRIRTDDGPSDGGGTLLNLNITGGEYFGVMGIKLLQGRTFTMGEAVTPNNSVIISRSTAEKLWPGQNALDRTLRPRFGGQDTLVFTVVGVVADVKQDDWRQPGQANVYFPLTGPSASTWSISSPAYVVKSSRADQLQGEVRELVRQAAPEAPVYREFTMEFLAERSMQQLSFTMLTLGVVAGLALLLGAIGLYGVLSYVVAERTREIGVRMALGATASAVRRMVVSQGTRVVLIGVVIGVAVAFASTRLLGTLLYGVKPVDPIVFAAMSAMMIAIGMLASYVPARRASSVNPIESLRSD
jgi:predicted permease